MRLGRGSRLQVTVLLAVAAWVLHEGRYALAFGSDTHGALAARGHAYLGVVGPVLAWASVVAAARFVAELARRSPPRGQAGTFGRSWAACSGSLVMIYSLQELAEGWLAAGHPSGVAAIFAVGGWWAVVLAVGLGALAALLIRGARALQELVAGRTPHVKRRAACFGRPVDLRPVRPGALAAHLAGRAPPASGSTDAI